MKFLENLKLVERIHHLIRRSATGQPSNLARRLGISERTLYRFIEEMRAMDFPIEYCSHWGSYFYTKPVVFPGLSVEVVEDGF